MEPLTPALHSSWERMEVEHLPLDLAPPRERLELAKKRAEECQRHASAAKALAAARDYLEAIEELQGLAGGAHRARAKLLEAIACRRLKRFEEARERYREAEAALDALKDSESSRVRAEVLLDRAIEAFVREDQLESARLNERAANVALATGHLLEGARGLLNAAISWDRLGERGETRKCLARAEEILARLPVSGLHASFSIFTWRQRLDHGPLPAGLVSLPESATQSQKTLASLYGWEHGLYTLGNGEAERLAQAFKARVRELGERQFQEELRSLEAASSFYFEGKKTGALLSLAEVSEALKGARKAPNGLHAMVAGWLRTCLVHGKWKSLSGLASFAEENAHPVSKTWGLRARAWLLARKGERAEALSLFERALKLGEENHLAHFVAGAQAEAQALGSGGATGSGSGTPWERKVFARFLSLVPGSGKSYLRISKEGRETLEESEALAALDRAQVAESNAIVIDGVRLNLSSGAQQISLEKKPVQRKLLFALFAAYPEAVKKEELVGLVWDEIYNPLTHDVLFHRTVSRLRGLAAPLKNEVVFEEGALRWKGNSPFLAFVPEQQRERQLARLTPRQIRVLTLLKYRGKLSRGEVVKALETSERTAVRELAFLVDRKLILRGGQGPATVYYPI